MSKVEIEVDIPKGWKAVAYRVPNAGEWYLGEGEIPCQMELRNCNLNEPWLVIEKEKPVRRVFEFTGEVRRVETGEYLGVEGGIKLWTAGFPTDGEYEIWKEVTEEENE